MFISDLKMWTELVTWYDKDCDELVTWKWLCVATWECELMFWK